MTYRLILPLFALLSSCGGLVPKEEVKLLNGAVIPGRRDARYNENITAYVSRQVVLAQSEVIGKVVSVTDSTQEVPQIIYSILPRERFKLVGNDLLLKNGIVIIMRPEQKTLDDFVMHVSSANPSDSAQLAKKLTPGMRIAVQTLYNFDARHSYFIERKPVDSYLPQDIRIK